MPTALWCSWGVGIFLSAKYPCSEQAKPDYVLQSSNLGSPDRPREFFRPTGAGRLSAIREYRGTSLIRNRHPVGPYCRTMPRPCLGSRGGGGFL